MMDGYITYKDFVEILLKKYGSVPYQYFIKENCKSSNRSKNNQPGKALYIHHIKEDSFLRLSKTEIAILLPFEYQKPQNLVYCNLYEHFLLHQKIILDGYSPISVDGKTRLDGVIHHIIPNLCSRFSGKLFPPEQNWLNIETQLVQQYRNEFVVEFAKLYNYIKFSKNKNAEDIRNRCKELNYKLNFPDFITQDKPGDEAYIPKTPMNDDEKKKYNILLIDIKNEIEKQAKENWNNNKC